MISRTSILLGPGHDWPAQREFCESFDTDLLAYLANRAASSEPGFGVPQMPHDLLRCVLLLPSAWFWSLLGPSRPVQDSHSTWCGRRAAFHEATGLFATKLKTYLKPSVLVVDEIGYLPLTRAEANMVFQLVSRRYERGAIVVTSNEAFSEWGQVLGDYVLAAAIWTICSTTAMWCASTGPLPAEGPRAAQRR